MRMFCVTAFPAWTTNVVLRFGFCCGAEFSPGGMTLRVTSEEADRPLPSSTVYLKASEPVLSAGTLTWKPVAKFVAWLTYLAGKSDCQMAVAIRPES